MSGSPPEVKRRMELMMHPVVEIPTFIQLMWRKGFLSAKQAITWREWGQPDPIVVDIGEQASLTRELVKSE